MAQNFLLGQLCGWMVAIPWNGKLCLIWMNPSRLSLSFGPCLYSDVISSHKASQVTVKMQITFLALLKIFQQLLLH